MLENRDYMRQPPEGYRFRWTATVVLVIVNAVLFVVQKGVLKPAFVNTYFALSLDGLRHYYLWQLLTFQFLHGGLLHLVFNCWALYMFGREVEAILGLRRYLTMYFVSGVIGGLFQELVALIWPQYFGSAVVGASAGILGVVAAFAMLFPERTLTLLVAFVIPVNLRAKYLLALSLVMAGLGIAFPESDFAGGVAHAAHLGGILTGLAFVRFGADSAGISWRPLGSSPPEKPAFPTPGWARIKREPAGVTRPEEFISKEVDPILDKISAHGIQSLTEQERKTLEAARGKMGKR